jgi:hypothetical protein
LFKLIDIGDCIGLFFHFVKILFPFRIYIIGQTNYYNKYILIIDIL